MKVHSPVGDYPYVVKKVRVRRGGRVVVEGGLGVWDTTFEIEPQDWAKLGRRLALPFAAGAALLVAARAKR